MFFIDKRKINIHKCPLTLSFNKLWIILNITAYVQKKDFANY